MRYDEQTDEFVLSTGRRIYANHGILGIDKDGWITEGYDGHVMSPDPETNRDIGGPELTDAERREISDHMVGLWSEFGK